MESCDSEKFSSAKIDELTLRRKIAAQRKPIEVFKRKNLAKIKHYHEADVCKKGLNRDSFLNSRIRFSLSNGKFKQKPYKPPLKKDNHDLLHYDYPNFPWSDLMQKAQSNNSDLPHGFEVNGPTHSVTINPDSSLSKETRLLFTTLDKSSEFWRFFATVKLVPGTPFLPVLGKLKQYREHIALGRDYVYAQKKETHWGREQTVNYIHFMSLDAALLGGFLIGAEADEFGILSALSRYSLQFNQMFTHIGGNLEKLLVTYHDEKWFQELKEVCVEMMNDCKELTCGDIRFGLSELRYKIRDMCIEKGEVPLDISMSFLDIYYPNKVHSLHKRSLKLKAKGEARKTWMDSKNNKKILLVNSLNNVVRFFRNFHRDRAKKEADALNEIRDAKKKGLSILATRIEGLNRKYSADDLRRVELDNKFLRSHPREYKLHPRFQLVFEVNEDLFGTKNAEELFTWKYDLERLKQPVQILNARGNMDHAQWKFAQQIFHCGANLSPDQLKIMYALKNHHDAQARKNSKETAYLAAYSAATRNEMRHQNEVSRLEEQRMRHAIDCTRIASGLAPIFDTDLEVSAEDKLEQVNETTKRIEARNRMIDERDGEFPAVDKGHQILKGFDFEITSHIFCRKLFKYKIGLPSISESNEGMYYKSSDSGLSKEEEEERGIKRTTLMDKFNDAYTEAERREIAKEELEPVHKIRKESDSSYSSNRLGKIENKGFEKGRMDCDVSAASLNPMDISLHEPPPNDSINKSAEGNEKLEKPKMERFIPRVKQQLKAIESKISGGNEHPVHEKYFNISDAELALLEFKAEDFAEISKTPYISTNGEVLYTLKTHKWEKRGVNPKNAKDELVLKQRISMTDMQRTWYSLVLMYPKAIRLLLKGIMQINQKRRHDRLNCAVILECADLQGDLEILEGGLNDSRWMETFAKRDDFGKSYCPLPTLQLYNTIMKYLPMAREKLGLKEKLRFKKAPTDVKLVSQMQKIHSSRLEDKNSSITNKDSPGRHSRENSQGRNRRNVKQEFLDHSAEETKRGNNILDESYDPVKFQNWLERNLQPQIDEFLENNPNFQISPVQNRNAEKTKSLNCELFPANPVCKEPVPTYPVQVPLSIPTSAKTHLENSKEPTKNDTGNLFINLDAHYGFEYLNEDLENGVIPIHNDTFSDPPKISSTPRRPVKKQQFTVDDEHIFAEELKCKKKDVVQVSLDKNVKYGPEIIETMPLGLALDKDKMGNVDYVIKEPYEPIFQNDKIKFQFGSNILSNPTIPNGATLCINVNGKEIKTILKNDKKKVFKPPKFLNMSIAYCNINPPIMNKLKKLVHLDSIANCSFICVSEVRSNMSLIEDLTLIPLGYRVFMHKRIPSDQCLAFILVKIDLEGELKVIFDEPPCILIEWKNKRKTTLIGCFYRPHGKSTIYEQDFSKDVFAKNIEDMTKLCDKAASIVFGDVNVNLEKVKLTEDHRIKRLIDRSFIMFERVKTGDTFFRKLGSTEGTKIDYIFAKGLHNLKYEAWKGRELIGNDGHVIMKVCTDLCINGILGTTIIKTRPKLEPDTVMKMGNGLYDNLMQKLNEAEKRVRAEYGVEEGERFHNKFLVDKDDNEYCELAFDFFEQFFSLLQPETEREVNIYNNPTQSSYAVTNLNIAIMSLVDDIKNAKNKAEVDDYELAYNKLCKLRDTYAEKDRKKNILNKINLNDDDIYTIAKALRPKMRTVQMTKEIFTADDLAKEYMRVYSTITKHICESEVTLDILQLCPRISKAMKFSFHDYLPSWNYAEVAVKTVQQCFNSMKATTRGMDSSLYRDGMAMLPAKYVEIIDNMILYWVKGGNYPKKFLTGKLKSILKKGDAKLIKNRRFISVGNFFQQLLGKITASCVLAYCEYIGILDDDQYGFRSRRSTTEAVAAFMYKVASKSDKCMNITMFIDFSSAFFCVKKDLLTEILETFIDDEAMMYFKALLAPISAKVISDGISSEQIEVPDFGVRQGGGDSPLQFNLVQNFIFKYVSIEPETRYDTRYRNLQGFADDSAMISSDIKTADALELMESGLKKVNDYVTSVGFCINPSKSEIFITCKKNRRGEFGKYLQTSQGEILIKRIVNFLGLRINDELSFKPQFTHLMWKITNMKYDIQEILRLGTCRQIVKVAFSKSTGVYLYGIGAQRMWFKYQYQKAQKQVNDLIRLVYDIKWENEKTWRQSDLLRQVNWPPIRIQHAKAALTLFNKIAKNRNIEFLFDKVNHHLRFPDGRKALEINFCRRLSLFEDDPLSLEYVPNIILNKDDIKYMSPKIKHMFPVSVAAWFNDLPNFIKVLVGSVDFDRAVHVYYKRACWHREAKDCSLCKHNMAIYRAEVDSLEKMVSYYAEEENITKEVFYETFSEEFFAENDQTFDDYHDFQHMVDEYLYETQEQ